jgi:hypothetical protein
VLRVYLRTGGVIALVGEFPPLRRCSNPTDP